jgi:hypothetical protein
MRVVLFTAVLLLCALAAAVAPAVQAAPVAPHGAAQEALAQEQQVDDNEDTLVEVQLVVLGLAAFVVVGVGLAGYLLRKRLGLVAGPPDQTGGHH